MVARPLMQFGIQELTDYSTRGDFERTLVLEELEFRTTKAARRLKESLTKAVTASAAEKKRTTTTNIPDRSSGQERDTSHHEQVSRDNCASSGNISRPAGADSDLLTRYEMLRATFTLEGETLARWGLTEEIPPEIEDEVFLLWRKRLSDSPDNRNRTRRQLEADLESLAAERSQRDFYLGKRADGS